MIDVLTIALFRRPALPLAAFLPFLQIFNMIIDDYDHYYG